MNENNETEEGPSERLVATNIANLNQEAESSVN